MLKINNKFPLAYVIIFVCLFIFANPVKAIKVKSYRAMIIKVVDGDTVWVKKNGKKIKLRLLGIDTPEKYESRKLYRDSRMCRVKQKQMLWLGKLASRHAKELLKPGQKVTVKVYGRGFYGRALAIIILPDGTNFNEAMVRDGYACVYKYRGHKSKELSWDEWARLNNLLENAREQKRGLWSVDHRAMECLCRQLQCLRN